MEKDVVAAIIAAVASIVVAVIGKEEVWNILKFGASKKNGYLKGEWICIWDTLVPVSRPQVTDRVSITSVRGNLVKGTGFSTELGKYGLDGRCAYLAASFSYSSLFEGEQLPGAIVIKIAQNKQEMSGAWAQYSHTGDVVSGTTVWHKAK